MFKKFKLLLMLCIGVPLIMVLAGLSWWYAYKIKGNYYIFQICRYTDSPPSNSDGYSSGLNTFNDEMPSSEIESLYSSSLARIGNACEMEPKVYRYEDALTWPRLRAVWQKEKHYLSVLVGMSNDNDSISWSVHLGQYEPEKEQTPAKLVVGDYTLPIRESNKKIEQAR